MTERRLFVLQGGHGTGKTGNLDVNFSRQRSRGNLVQLFYKGKIVATQKILKKFAIKLAMR